MSAVFKENVYTVIDGIRYVIQSDNDIVFRVGTDIMEDGSYQYGDDMIITVIPTNSYEKNLISFIKSKLKTKEATIRSDIQGAISDNNLDGGNKDVHLWLNYNIYRAVKNVQGYTIKSFITKAILEKLERDNLI